MAMLDQAGSRNGWHLWMTVLRELFAIIYSTLCTRFWNDFWVRGKLLKHWFTGANKLLVRLNYCDACQGSISFPVVWVHIMETGDDLAGFCVGSLHIAITRVKPFDLLNWVWFAFRGFSNPCITLQKAKYPGCQSLNSDIMKRKIILSLLGRVGWVISLLEWEQ